MYDTQGLGVRIGELRRLRGFTQQNFAARLGVSPQAVSKWETGLGYPDIVLLPAVARELGVTIESLFDPEAAAKLPPLPGAPGVPEACSAPEAPAESPTEASPPQSPREEDREDAENLRTVANMLHQEAKGLNENLQRLLEEGDSIQLAERIKADAEQLEAEAERLIREATQKEQNARETPCELRDEADELKDEIDDLQDELHDEEDELQEEEEELQEEINELQAEMDELQAELEAEANELGSRTAALQADIQARRQQAQARMERQREQIQARRRQAQARVDQQQDQIKARREKLEARLQEIRDAAAAKAEAREARWDEAAARAEAQEARYDEAAARAEAKESGERKAQDEQNSGTNEASSGNFQAEFEAAVREFQRFGAKAERWVETTASDAVRQAMQAVEGVLDGLRDAGFVPPKSGGHGEDAPRADFPPHLGALRFVYAYGAAAVYADLPSYSIDRRQQTVRFSDGSTADLNNHTIVNRGGGQIRFLFTDGQTPFGGIPYGGVPNGGVPNGDAATSLDRALPAVHSLDLRITGSGDVSIRRGGPENGCRVRAQGSPGFIAGIRLEARDGVLFLEHRPHPNPPAPFQRVKNQVQIETGFARGQRCSLRITGSGNIVCEPDFDETETAITGSGDISLRQAGRLSASISGSGDLDCQIARDPRLQIAGSGDMKVRQVSGAAVCRVAGSGDIGLGEGTLDTLELSISGSGDFDAKSITVRDAKIIIMGGGDAVIGRVTGNSVEKISRGANLRILKRGT